MRKSRLSPMKRTSILRLDMVAAVLAAKLGSLIENELDIKIDELCCSTDTAVVLPYIYNARQQLHQSNNIKILAYKVKAV